MTQASARAAGLFWALLLLVAAAAGFAGARFAGLLEAPEPPGPVAAQPADPAVLARLDRRLAALEQQAANHVAPATADAQSREPTHAREPAFDLSILDKLDERLTAVERQLAALPRLNPPQPEAPRPRDPAQIARDLATTQQGILDANSTPEQKLQHWRRLRAMENAYSDAVVQQMVNLGLTSPDAATRADVWRQADSRSKHPALAVAMIRALQSDTDDDVREEAAESLENYADRADVQQVLTWARDSDKSEGVRRYAARSLERRDRSGR